MTTNSIPTFTQQLSLKGITNKVWYNFFLGLWNGIPAGSEIPVTVTASPMIYLAAQGGFLIVSGGTVSAISLSRNGTTFYSTGVTSGTFPLSNGDSIQITYSVAPTLTFFPQ